MEQAPTREHQRAGRTAEPQDTITVEQTIETGGKRQWRIEAARGDTSSQFRARRYVPPDCHAGQEDLHRHSLVQALHTLASPNLQTMDEVERLQRLRAEKGDIVEIELTRLHVQRFACERDATDAAQALQAATIIACAL